MALIGKSAEAIDDTWTRVAEDAPLPDAPVLIPLARLLAEPALADHPTGLGVALPPEADVAAIAPFLDRLRLIALAFPIFRDGRAFTQARALRERGFCGDIRATGHVLPDQFLWLLRCGVTSIELPSNQTEAAWRRALALHPMPQAIPLLRRIRIGYETV